MLFNSYTFFIFLLVVFGLHYLPVSWRTKKVQLLCASYLFYAAWNPPFVLLLWISTIADWFIARGIQGASTQRRKRMLLCCSLGLNLGMLGYFKYGEFVLENFLTLLGSLGIDYQVAAPSIILPVGISFYTFQTLSYTIDVYLGKARPWHSFLDYALYVTFFPQLVAGPIVRATQFLPQFVAPALATARQFGWGLFLLLMGLFEKIVLADGVFAPLVEKVYDGRAPDFAAAWLGTIAFAGQIFCDFSGYSTCAIGVAMCLGFSLPDNFRAPYAAIGFSDFWRRWHISLSTWLRDYLYITLGGNRRGHLRTYANLMITMLLGGLWHGASWMFVVWGALHGLYLCLERFAVSRIRHRPWMSSWLFRIFLGQLTFALVCITWVFFRAENIDQAFAISGAMLGFAGPDAVGALARREVVSICAAMGALLVCHWRLRDQTLESMLGRFPWWLRSLLVAGMIFAIFTMSGDSRAFVYFQF
ncbi:MAG: MBOAT family O-acyltransferase [Planctomycetota bacterium]